MSAPSATVPDSAAKAFWDETLRQKTLPVIEPAAFYENWRFTKRAFLDRLGDPAGKRVLEVGCGNGHLSMYMAKLGAHVTATDFSTTSIEQLAPLAEKNGVADRVVGHQCDALDLRELLDDGGEPYDLVYGKYILHHVEPFDQFADVLRDVTAEGGRGVFLENNGRNPLLNFSRNYLAGRGGIPKHGDDDEIPLLPEEVEMLRARFPHVEVLHPDFVFFRKLNTYVFKHQAKYGRLLKLTKDIDQALWRAVPPVRKYSYYQIVEFAK
ncbi:MAG: methyltransferase domain-containing protein [Bacteroidota bacterium]